MACLEAPFRYGVRPLLRGPAAERWWRLFSDLGNAGSFPEALRLINEHDERLVLRPFVPNDLSQFAHVDHLAANWTGIEIVLFVGIVGVVTLTRNRRSNVGWLRHVVGTATAEKGSGTILANANSTAGLRVSSCV